MWSDRGRRGLAAAARFRWPVRRVATTASPSRSGRVAKYPSRLWLSGSAHWTSSSTRSVRPSRPKRAATASKSSRRLTPLSVCTGPDGPDGAGAPSSGTSDAGVLAGSSPRWCMASVTGTTKPANGPRFSIVHRPQSTDAPLRATSRANSSTRRVFPMPASPATSTTLDRSSQAARSLASCSARPTKGCLHLPGCPNRATASCRPALGPPDGGPAVSVARLPGRSLPRSAPVPSAGCGDAAAIKADRSAPSSERASARSSTVVSLGNRLRPTSREATPAALTRAISARRSWVRPDARRCRRRSVPKLSAAAGTSGLPKPVRSLSGKPFACLAKR